MTLLRARRSTEATSAVPLVEHGVHSLKSAQNLPLELVPVPAATLGLNGGHFHFLATNRPFRALGMGAAACDSPVVRVLGNAIRGFLDSNDCYREVDWQLGSAIDSRHFRVVLSRRSVDEGAVDGELQCLVSLLDHTSELRTEQSLRREMAKDSLTGLPNRTGFSEEIEQAITAENRSSYAVIVVDLVRFGRVNACMGSIVGDELLISVARRIKGALRAHDTLARLGGDEFGALIRLDDGECDALRVARRIEAALVNPFGLSDFEIRVECSIGIALGEDSDGEPENLVRNGQFAVKRSKKSGHLEVYHNDAFDIARGQFSTETELRRAIDNRRLSLFYQPICDLSSGRIVSFEALARWTNEEGEDVSPNLFIPVAEESGLIVPLGRWAMDEAAKTIAEWDRIAGGNSGVRIAVNLSAIQLQRDDVPDVVQQALDYHKVSGERLTLELTESAIVSDPDRITQIMHALKDLGATLAMDDFGTGYSNLAYLQKLPIDLLKIDRSFIHGMLADQDKIAIVRAILSLAQALKMQTTAEGVETRELAQTLAALGCSYGQGYHYSRALSGREAYCLLAATNALPTIASAI